MLKSKNIQMVSVGDWDALVEKIYARPYSFQQQRGCQDRGLFQLTIPARDDDYTNDTLPEEINGDEMGVSFQAWLERDPSEWNGSASDQRYVHMFWERNFYPDIQTVANDLHKKGLIEAGTYTIQIDW